MLRDVVNELLSAYRDLRKHLSHQLRNPEDAADVAQASFERVFARAATPRKGMAPIESPRALLFHTARNLCIDASRRRQTEKAWLDYCTAEMIDAAAPSAEHVAEQRQLVMRISQLLAQLPERRRDVFILFKVYAYTREEIALRLGISESAVAKHVVRATLDCATALADLSSHTYRQAADAGKLAGLDVRAQPPAAIHAG